MARRGETQLELGPIDDFPVGAFRIVVAAGREVGVLRAADGQWHAFRNWCPHRGAPVCRGKLTGTTMPSAPGALTWGLEASVLRCPWHGYEFDVETGRRPFIDSRMQLRKYPVVVEGGVVHIDLSPRRSNDRDPQEARAT